MPHITTCTRCSRLYEAQSEEDADDPQRLCRRCYNGRVAASVAASYPPHWPTCPGCGLPVLDGHMTCGDLACREAAPLP